ncbi:hypothetical protein EAF04_003571 [Stromatinia cepivora]|nr:hypothetical protein EAF04_003571 [Stromatinia cepivora]
MHLALKPEKVYHSSSTWKFSEEFIAKALSRVSSEKSIEPDVSFVELLAILILPLGSIRIYACRKYSTGDISSLKLHFPKNHDARQSDIRPAGSSVPGDSPAMLVELDASQTSFHGGPLGFSSCSVGLPLQMFNEEVKDVSSKSAESGDLPGTKLNKIMLIKSCIFIVVWVCG